MIQLLLHCTLIDMEIFHTTGEKFNLCRGTKGNVCNLWDMEIIFFKGHSNHQTLPNSSPFSFFHFRFVKAGGKDKIYTFTVPYDGCGSKASCSVCASVDNILVIQSDEAITETWDTARRITCSRSETTEKTIYFKPFVGMLI